MTSRRDIDDNGSNYEGLLVINDRRDRRSGLIVMIFLSLALSSYFNVWSVFWHIVPLLVCGAAWVFWDGCRTVRMGYQIRGNALLSGLWEYLAAMIFLSAAFWVQSEFGLWFAQYEFPG